MLKIKELAHIKIKEDNRKHLQDKDKKLFTYQKTGFPPKGESLF